jgi:hypothetical protein
LRGFKKKRRIDRADIVMSKRIQSMNKTLPFAFSIGSFSLPPHVEIDDIVVDSVPAVGFSRSAFDFKCGCGIFPTKRAMAIPLRNRKCLI